MRNFTVFIEEVITEVRVVDVQAASHFDAARVAAERWLSRGEPVNPTRFAVTGRYYEVHDDEDADCFEDGDLAE